MENQFSGISAHIPYSLPSLAIVPCQLHLPQLRELSIAAGIAFQTESFVSHVSFIPYRGFKSIANRMTQRAIVVEPCSKPLLEDFYGRFNDLEILLQYHAVDESSGACFKCFTLPNDTESGGRLNVTLVRLPVFPRSGILLTSFKLSTSTTT